MTRQFFEQLYDSNDEYISRRNPQSHSACQVSLEARLFKIPNLVALLPKGRPYCSVIEIGCGTGELIAAFPPSPLASDGTLRRVGFDISPMNIAAARVRFPQVKFLEQDFADSGEYADIVVLSDIIEHVPDDAEFLRAAAKLGPILLLNLPLEDNWLNRNRKYGVDDPSGHLRRYSVDEGLRLVARAGLTVVQHNRVWSHESDYDAERRILRRAMLGSAHSGPLVSRSIKRSVHTLARSIRPLGRIIYPSNLFICASTGP